MSHNDHSRPSWKLLYLLLVILLVAFLIELKLFPLENERRTIELVNILLIYGLVWIWMRLNEGALMWEELHRTQPAQTDETASTQRAERSLGWSGWRRTRRLAWMFVVPALAIILCSVLALPLQARAALLGLGLAWLPLSRMIEVS